MKKELDLDSPDNSLPYNEPTIEVGEFYLGRLIGLMLTTIEATVPTENRKAAKDLTKQLIRTWFNDCSHSGQRYADLGNLGEDK